MKSIYQESKYLGNYKFSVEAYWNERHKILLVEVWTEVDGDRVDDPKPKKFLEFQDSHSQSIRRAIELFDIYYRTAVAKVLHDIYADVNSVLENLAEAHTQN